MRLDLDRRIMEEIPRAPRLLPPVTFIALANTCNRRLPRLLGGEGGHGPLPPHLPHEEV